MEEAWRSNSEKKEGVAGIIASVSLLNECQRSMEWISQVNLNFFFCKFENRNNGGIVVIREMKKLDCLPLAVASNGKFLLKRLSKCMWFLMFSWLSKWVISVMHLVKIVKCIE